MAHPARRRQAPDQANCEGPGRRRRAADTSQAKTPKVALVSSHEAHHHQPDPTRPDATTTLTALVCPAFGGSMLRQGGHRGPQTGNSRDGSARRAESAERTRRAVGLVGLVGLAEAAVIASVFVAIGCLARPAAVERGQVIGPPSISSSRWRGTRSCLPIRITGSPAVPPVCPRSDALPDSRLPGRSAGRGRLPPRSGSPGPRLIEGAHRPCSRSSLLRRSRSRPENQPQDSNHYRTARAANRDEAHTTYRGRNPSPAAINPTFGVRSGGRDRQNCPRAATPSAPTTAGPQHRSGLARGPSMRR